MAIKSLRPKYVANGGLSNQDNSVYKQSVAIIGIIVIKRNIIKMLEREREKEREGERK